MSVEPQRVGVVFGGRSVEHDVSIITAQQVIAALQLRHTVTPFYVDSDGRWWTGEELCSIDAFDQRPPRGARPAELRIGSAEPFVEPATGRFRGGPRALPVDVVINAVHGTGGEDGTLLGALELAGVPYVGRGVASCAVAMDKHLAKLVVADAGIDVLEHRRFERVAWERDRAAVLSEAQTLGSDLFVKPATLGSSIGVAHCHGRDALEEALELAFELDRQAIVEPFAAGAVELNVAVLGRPGGAHRVSEVERPLGSADGLSFEDKYMRAGGKGAKGSGGAKGGGMQAQDRVIPADVDPGLRANVQALAERAHTALRLAGVTRYDFFVFDDGKRIVLNEPNTVPGSFAFYLFEPAGLNFPDLLDELIAIALAETREERSTTRSFESALLTRHVAGAA